MIDLRRYTLEAIDRFCAANGFPTPELDERRNGRLVEFRGKAPDGREFGLAYESSPEQELAR